MTFRNGLIACLVCLGVFVLPATANAQNGFFGVVPQHNVEADDFALMKSGGIESMVWAINWGSIEPTRNNYSLTNMDNIVGNAAKAGITILPVIYASPSWVNSNPRDLPVGSTELAYWNAMLGTLVSRYGSNGSYWATHPSTPKVPVVNWQIWNEQNTIWFARPAKPSDYAALVIQSAATIRSQDPNGKTLIGGMYSTPTPSQGTYATNFMDSAYQVPGFQSSFDGVAVHPYAASIDRSVDDISDLRTEMNQWGDNSKGIYVTEVGWGSDSRTSLGQGSRDGQATQLTNAYKAFLGARDSLGISAVYWFAWEDASLGENTCNFCFGTGLTDSSGNPKPAWNALTAIIASQKPADNPTPVGVDPGVVAQCVVPNLRSKHLKQARRLLRNANCGVQVVRGRTRAVRHHKWTVMAQSKKPSSVWPAGQKVRVVVARHKHKRNHRRKHGHRHPHRHRR